MTAGRLSVLIVGAGGHARACIDVVESTGELAIGGLIGAPSDVGGEVLGYRVIGTDADLGTLRAAHECALVGVGQIKSAQTRRSLFETLVGHGFRMPVVVSPRAYVSRHAIVGDGTIVMHGAVVNAGARIGRNCIINSQALVEHDVVIGDHCHVATGARVNGGVEVGSGTFIGSGSTILQGIRIGDECLVPMGASLRSDCASGSVALPSGRE